MIMDVLVLFWVTVTLLFLQSAITQAVSKSSFEQSNSRHISSSPAPAYPFPSPPVTEDIREIESSSEIDVIAPIFEKGSGGKKSHFSSTRQEIKSSSETDDIAPIFERGGSGKKNHFSSTRQELKSSSEIDFTAPAFGKGGSGKKAHFSSSHHSDFLPDFSEHQRCEEITIPMCRGIGYNHTKMPNELNHDTQEEAGFEVHQYWPLVEIKCSADLKFFLCSVYAPICLPGYTKPLPACRTVCERARTGCAPLMQQYSFSWPEHMDCDRLPSKGDPENLCMEEDHMTTSAPSLDYFGTTQSPMVVPFTKQSKTPKTQLPKCKPGKSQKNCQPIHATSEKDKDCSCKCRAPLVTVSRLPSVNKIMEHGMQQMTVTFTDLLPHHKASIIGIPDCAIPCEGAFLTSEERKFTTLWLTIWSGLCAASTFTTVVTFLIDTQRFRYPEKPIVFLSACYLFVSIGYIIRSFLGHEAVACEGNTLLYGGGRTPGICIINFLLIYFFGMASSVWWVVLAFSWFLAAGLKWGNEAIASYSSYFHLAAWLAPTAQTIFALLTEGTAGDPVAGVCTVAPDGVRTFILAPLIIYLLLGTKFLLAGFVSLFRIRSAIKNQPGVKADKLEKLMIRIGVFSVLYTVPASILLACYLYEMTFKNEWLASIACPCRARKRPMYSVLMLKYFMTLAVGITSGVWIWSGKTVSSWRRFWNRLLGRKQLPLSTSRRHMRAGILQVPEGSLVSKGIINHGSVMTQYTTPTTDQDKVYLRQNSMSTTTTQYHKHSHLLKQPLPSHV